MWNAGRAPARMIEMISAAGIENFFGELADLTAAGPPLTDARPRLTGTGLQPGQPSWLPG